MKLRLPRPLPVLIVALALVGIVRATAIVEAFAAGDGDARSPVVTAPAPVPQVAPEPMPEPVLLAEMPLAPGAGGDQPAEAEGEAAAAPRDILSYDPTELRLLQQLAGRRAEIERTESELAMREKLLAAAERRVDDKIAELNDLKTEISRLVARYDEEQEAEVASLVKVYEAMKPRDAARIFDEMPIDMLTEIAGRMREMRLAPVLAAMRAERVRELTMRLGERRTLADAGVANRFERP